MTPFSAGEIGSSLHVKLSCLVPEVIWAKVCKSFDKIFCDFYIVITNIYLVDSLFSCLQIFLNTFFWTSDLIFFYQKSSTMINHKYKMTTLFWDQNSSKKCFACTSWSKCNMLLFKNKYHTVGDNCGLMAIVYGRFKWCTELGWFIHLLISPENWEKFTLTYKMFCLFLFIKSIVSCIEVIQTPLLSIIKCNLETPLSIRGCDSVTHNCIKGFWWPPPPNCQTSPSY